MRIYRPDGTYKNVILTKEAEHEEELMKSDFVRLSWVDYSYEVLPVGSYIIPFEDVVDVAGEPAKFTLYKAYVPSDTPQGFRYEPEFQHPKMWLGYVPFLYPTQDGAGNEVRKTEHNEVGRLSDILGNVCSFINDSLGLTVANGGSGQGAQTRFVPIYYDIDSGQTVSVMFQDADVLSAITAIANVVGCEWHLDWQLRFLYFGKIKTGVTPYRLIVDKNVGTPSVTNSKDILYNRYLVQGSTRNNVRETEHGWQATGTRLLLSEDYEGSIIDLRRVEPHRSSDAFINGRDGEPTITGIMNLDDVYPHLDLYLYDVRERKKWKVDADKNVTNERWSVWYAKLAYKDGQGTWHDYVLDDEPSVKVIGDPIEAISDGPIVKVTSLVTNLPWSTKYFKGSESEVIFGGYHEPGYVVTVSIGGYTCQMTAIAHFLFNRQTMRSEGNGNVVLAYTGNDWASVKAAVNSSEDKEVTFKEGVNVKAFPSTNIKSKRVDGLVPSLGFRVNMTAGAMLSPLGTREFEVEYRNDSVTFNLDDDVERPSGESGFGYKGDTLGAGYYEIIHKEEGSDKLIVPTTSEQGIVPVGGVTPSEQNNKAFMFNVAPDGAMMEIGHQELYDKAMEEVGNILADTNNYTFQSNPVAFEDDNPKLTIGRSVEYVAYGYTLRTRILKLVTKIDYPFEQSITIGNKMLKGINTRLREEIDALKSDFNGWTAVSDNPYSDTEKVTDIYYDTWEAGTLYYHEDWNRYHVNSNGENEPIIEQSYVRHYGCLWRCMRTLTQEEPFFWNCTDWQFVDGNRNLSMEFTSSRGYSFRHGYVNTDITPYVYVGNNDISSRIAAEYWNWTRETEAGKDEADRAWDAQHAGTRVLTLTDNEMPISWSSANKTIFTCTVTVNDGENTVIVENQVIA